MFLHKAFVILVCLFLLESNYVKASPESLSATAFEKEMLDLREDVLSALEAAPGLSESINKKVGSLRSLLSQSSYEKLVAFKRGVFDVKGALEQEGQAINSYRLLDLTYDQLDNYERFISEVSPYSQQINFNNVKVCIAEPFNASSGFFDDSQNHLLIGGDKGELSIFDTITGGEVMRSNLGGVIKAIFRDGDDIFIIAHPSGGPHGWGARLWMMNYQRGNLKCLPVNLTDTSSSNANHLVLMGFKENSDQLLFVDTDSTGEIMVGLDRYTHETEIINPLYIMSPKNNGTFCIQDISNLVNQERTFRFDESPFYFHGFMGYSFVGKGYQGFFDFESKSELINFKGIRYLQNELYEKMMIIPYENRWFKNKKKNLKYTSEKKPPRLLSKSIKTGDILSTRQYLLQEDTWWGQTIQEWKGSGTPMLTRNFQDSPQTNRLKFTGFKNVVPLNDDFLLKSWTQQKEVSGDSRFQRINNFDKKPDFKSIEDVYYDVYIAQYGSLVVGNFGFTAYDLANAPFMGIIENETLPEKFDWKEKFPIGSNQHIKFQLDPLYYEKSGIQQPSSIIAFSEKVCITSSSVGLIYNYYDCSSGNWTNRFEGFPEGCSGALVNFRESSNGDWLLADSMGFTHILFVNSQGLLYSPFKIRALQDGSSSVVTHDNFYFSNSKERFMIFFSVRGRAYPFEQFDLRLNRPDIVLERLGAPGEAIAIAKQLREKRLKRMGVTEDMLQPDFHLPEIEIVGDLPSSTAESELALKIKASDSKYPLDRLRLYVNNVPVNGKEGELLRDSKSQTLERTIPIKLAAGRNKIQVSVLNSAGAESLYANAEVTCTAQRPKPTLYAVAMGVSEYANPDWNLKYAAKDARDILERLKARSGASYGEIKELLLTDRDATKESLGKIREFLSKATVDDTVLLFVAGHGLLDSKYDYYFGTSDIDFNNPSENGIAFEEFDDLLAELPCLRKSLLIDTCHAGELDEEEKKMLAGAQTNPNQVVAMLPTGARGMAIKPIEGARGKSEWHDRLQGLFVDLRRGSGSTILSSSSGAEYALESSEQKNGLFTYAVLEALDGKEGSDANKDGSVTMSELADYVKNRVAALTNNKQSPNVRRVNLEGDFALSKK